MQLVTIVVLGLHVLTGVFWAGTTITLARDPDIRAERFFGPQMGSATIVFITGLLLWYFFHNGVFGGMETVLTIGIVCAIAAAGVLGAMVGSARRQLKSAGAGQEAALRARMNKGERIAAGLLVVTVVCMAIARLF
jgi:hypothetical protein